MQSPPLSAISPILAEAIRLRQANDPSGALALADPHVDDPAHGPAFLTISGMAAQELGHARPALGHFERLV